MPTEQATERPPYISFTTLINFLERLGEGPIPPRIDKSALDTYSGGVQAILLASLRSMDFIDEDGTVQPSLIQASRDESARKAHLEGYARHVYAKQLELAEANGTAQMLQESFQEYGFSGSTLRKAIVFYLAFTDYLGLPRSPHFRAPRQPPSGSGGRKRKAKAADDAKPKVEEPVATSTPGAAAESRVFELGDGLARVSVTVEARWLELPLETMTKLRQVIAMLDDPAAEAGADEDAEDWEDE